MLALLKGIPFLGGISLKSRLIHGWRRPRITDTLGYRPLGYDGDTTAGCSAAAPVAAGQHSAGWTHDLSEPLSLLAAVRQQHRSLAAGARSADGGSDHGQSQPVLPRTRLGPAG